MNDQIDELAKGVAQSVTRRGALKKFGLGVAAIVLTSLGLPSRGNPSVRCQSQADCDALGLGFACCKGRCVNVDFDTHNCGYCGNRCPNGKYSVCWYGFCTYDYPI